MIQPNELRKGSKIIANGLHGGRIMTVDRLADKGTLSEENRPVMFEEHEVGEFLKDCEGIQLTPEILEATGFDNREGYLWFLNDDFYVHFRDGSLVYNGLPDGAPALHYLHQLQNLYFALTGSELTINLEKVKV